MKLKTAVFLAVLTTAHAVAAIQYAGGTNVNATFVSDGTRQQLISSIEDQLNTAGWTTVSGHHTATIVLTSATAPAGNNISIRLKDPGSGNCSTVELTNAALTQIAQTNFLLPTNGVTFRVIANQYQAFVLVPGSTASRTFAAFGTPYVPSFVYSSLSSSEIGWIQGNSTTDAGAAAMSFRTELCPAACSNTSATTRSAAIWNGTVVNYAAASNNCIGCVRLIPFSTQASTVAALSGQWADLSQMASDAIVCWGSDRSISALAYGQIWDAIVLSEQWNPDLPLSLDSHSWLTVTASIASNTKGTLAIVVP